MKNPLPLLLTAALAGAGILSLAAAQTAPADVLIAGGEVYSGEDKPSVRADVVIAGDKIVYVGPDAATRYKAKRVIDAKGRIVSPGFIDGHSHPEHWLESQDPKQRALMPWITQGTAVLLKGIEAEGKPEVAEEAAHYARVGVGANLVPFVGYRVLRGEGGVLGNADRAPTPAEMEKAKTLVKKAMCEGAWGLSINLFSAPNSYSTTEEIIPIAAEAARYGGIYHVHERDEASYTIGLMGSTLESIRVGRQAHIPVQITHIKAIGPDVWGQSKDVIAAINKARAEGVNVWADQYPWTAAASGVQKMLMPRWAEDGGRAAMLARFQDPRQLEKIRAAMRENFRKRGGPETLLLISAGQEWTGKTLAQMAQAWKVSPEDAAIRVISNGGVKGTAGLTPGDVNGGGLASFSLKDADVNLFMRQPWMTMSSDAGSNHPRTYATMPQKFFKYAVRDKVITVQHFIRSATGLEADYLKLDRRGYLKPGYFADVVVFDPQLFRPRADYVHFNVPTEGVDALFINGRLAVQNSRPTGVLAGRTLLHKAPAGLCP